MKNTEKRKMHTCKIYSQELSGFNIRLQMKNVFLEDVYNLYIKNNLAQFEENNNA